MEELEEELEEGRFLIKKFERGEERRKNQKIVEDKQISDELKRMREMIEMQNFKIKTKEKLIILKNNVTFAHFNGRPKTDCFY